MGAIIMVERGEMRKSPLIHRDTPTTLSTMVYDHILTFLSVSAGKLGIWMFSSYRWFGLLSQAGQRSDKSLIWTSAFLSCLVAVMGRLSSWRNVPISNALAAVCHVGSGWDWEYRWSPFLELEFDSPLCWVALSFQLMYWNMPMTSDIYNDFSFGKSI